MKKRCGAPITSSISARAPACTAAKSWRRERLREIEQNADSETGRCLKTPLCHPTRKTRRSLGEVEHWIEIRGAHANNLEECRCSLSGRPTVGHHRHFRLRKIDFDGRRPVAGGESEQLNRRKKSRRRRSVQAGQRRGANSKRFTKSINRPSEKRRARRRRLTSKSSTKSGIFMRSCRSRACAVIPRAGFRSMPKAGAANRAKARA